MATDVYVEKPVILKLTDRYTLHQTVVEKYWYIRDEHTNDACCQRCLGALVGKRGYCAECNLYTCAKCLVWTGNYFIEQPVCIACLYDG